MKALLVLQEGPGAGSAHPLNPRTQPVTSVGRSSKCDIRLNDQRASRHHCDIWWNGHAWEVTDQGSTNGTYLNGVQIQGPRELRLGDRITVGETTMVLREPTSQAAAPMAPPVGRQLSGVAGRVDPSRGNSDPDSLPRSKASETARGRPGLAAAYWVIQALVAASIACLSAGAFLPWLQVAGSLAQDLQPLLQGLANVVAVLSGQDSIFNVSQQIGGLEGYGKLTLLVAIVSTVVLVVDIFAHRRSAISGIVYLLCSLMAGGAIAFDLVNYYRFYSQMKDLTLLFGIHLEEVVEVFDQFMDVSITPLIGLVLTGIGLALLLVGAVGRLSLAFLDQGRSQT